MTTLDRLLPADVRAVVTAYRDALRSHQQAINRLNVYPVPDGDTGTNMALTLESVVAGLDAAAGMGATCTAISHASLMGARGNSGIILSQILRGLAERFRGLDAVGPVDLADALGEASVAADAAVMEPVEGTILTVAREAAAGAAEAAGRGKGLVDVVEAARVNAVAAVERTPDQLPVLKRAGVVDAGGVGFALLLDALLLVTAGRPLPEPAEGAGPVRATVAEAPSGPGPGTGRDVAATRFEVMYLLDLDAAAAVGFKQAWAAIGDSIVVVGGDGLWNCHVHTDDVGAAVEAALDAGGRPRRIRVTDLHEQGDELCHGQADAPPPVADAPPDGWRPPATTAVVAVVNGDGLARIFRSLGAAGIVQGGQSMNPSTAEILAAVEAVDAAEVVLLPNNANIVPVARRVAEVASRVVRVVATTDVAQGLAALLPFDAAEGAAANAEAMAAEAARVVSGEITRAVRAASSDAGPVREGDWIGLSSGRIQVVAAGLAAAAEALLDRLVTDDHEVVTVVEGDGAGPADTLALSDWLDEHRPNVAVEVHHGGQPLYPYLFAVE